MQPTMTGFPSERTRPTALKYWKCVPVSAVNQLVSSSDPARKTARSRPTSMIVMISSC